MNDQKKPSASFWVVAVLALIWYGIGCFFYLLTVYMTPEMMATMPEAQQELMNNTPAWVTAAFAISVWIGLLGTLLLLLRKKAAYQLFVISFLALLVQTVYLLFMSNALEVLQTSDHIRTVFVIAISIFLIWYSKKSISEGLLK